MDKSRYSSSCADMMVYNFDRLVETGDLRYVLKEWDEKEEVEYDPELAEDLWGDIYDEFCRIADDNKTILYYKTVQELTQYRTVEIVAHELLKMAIRTEDELARMACFIMLRDYGFGTNPEWSLEQRVDATHGLLRFYKNKIELKENELEGLKGDGEKMPLMKQVVRMETALGRNLIDPKVTSIEKWQYMILEIKEKAQNGK